MPEQNNNFAELLVSGLPIKRLFDPDLRITSADVAAVYKLDKQLAAGISAILNGSRLPLESAVSKTDLTTYMDKVTDLSTGLVLGDIINGLERSDIDGVEVAGVITALQQVALERLPNKDHPSHTESSKFLWILRVLDNPFYILNLMSNQMLTDIEVKAVKTVYPTIYQLLVDNIIGALVQSGTQLTRPITRMLAILLETPITTPEVLLAYTKGETKQKSEGVTADLSIMTSDSEKGNK